MNPAPSRDQARRRATRFGVSFILVLGCLLPWALAMPLFSGPDEIGHMQRAYALVHGETSSSIQVPTVMARSRASIDCLVLAPERPADCVKLKEDGPLVSVNAKYRTYPPFYYLLVGWPSLYTSGSTSIYLMRLCSAVLVALLMALSIENMARMRVPAPLLLGLTVAVTPAALYFGAMVNPSGISIAAAFAAWTGGISLARSDCIENLGWRAARVVLPLCLLLALRRDAVVWAALIVASLVALTPRARARELTRSRASWALAVAAVAWAVWQLVVSGLDFVASFTNQAGTEGGRFWGAVGDAELYARQIQGGVLRWLDVTLPFPVFYIFLVSTGFLVVTAIGFAGRRVSVTLLAMGLVAAAAPLITGTIRWTYFQGRYMLPFTIGLPIVAGLGMVEALRGRRLPRRLLWLLLPLLAFAQIISFTQTLRRYVSGATQDWWIYSSPKWQPPAGHPTVMVILYSVAVVALYGWLYLLARPARAASAPCASSVPLPAQ